MPTATENREQILNAALIVGLVYAFSKTTQVIEKVSDWLTVDLSDDVPEWMKDEHRAKVEALTIDRDKLTMNLNAYKEIAQAQFDAMAGWGTNVGLLKSSLEGLNPDELRTVWVMYGIRKLCKGCKWGNLFQNYRDSSLGIPELSQRNYDMLINDYWSKSGLIK